jgi:hypothetical protein
MPTKSEVQEMDALLNVRVRALQQALDDEVRGLWVSDKMAVAILARLDTVTSAALKRASKRNDSSTLRASSSNQRVVNVLCGALPEVKTREHVHLGSRARWPSSGAWTEAQDLRS